MVRRRFQKLNIYESAVAMIKAMPNETKFGGENLVKWYLENLGCWLEKTGQEESLRNEYITEEVQEKALKTYPLGQKALVATTFHISQEKLVEHIKKVINDLMEEKEYVKVAELAVQHCPEHRMQN